MARQELKKLTGFPAHKNKVEYVKICAYDKCGIEFTTNVETKKYCCAKHRQNVLQQNWRIKNKKS